MQLVVVVLSVLVMALAAVLFAVPVRFIDIARSLMTLGFLYGIGAIRVVAGGLLFFVAPGSRAPNVLRVLGIVVVVAGILTPVFGLDRTRQALDWMAAQGPGLGRVLAALIFALGLSLIYAVSGRKSRR